MPWCSRVIPVTMGTVGLSLRGSPSRLMVAKPGSARSMQTQATSTTPWDSSTAAAGLRLATRSAASFPSWKPGMAATSGSWLTRRDAYCANGRVRGTERVWQGNRYISGRRGPERRLVRNEPRERPKGPGVPHPGRGNNVDPRYDHGSGRTRRDRLVVIPGGSHERLGGRRRPAADADAASRKGRGRGRSHVRRGATWVRVGPLNGFRNSVAWIPGLTDTAVAVGHNGSDVSVDGGKTWTQFDSRLLLGVAALSKDACWAVGQGGIAAKLII
jgi:hypothetical protein